MRRPAYIHPWFSREEFLLWLREAPDKDAYQKRLAIWMTMYGPTPAHEVAAMLGVSKQAVWLWISQYNRQGPQGLERQGRGGRRWAFLSWAEEEAILNRLRKQAEQGEILTAKTIRTALTARLNREVSLAYVYRLLSRHGWRKVGPRPRHRQSDSVAQEEFKKNSLS